MGIWEYPSSWTHSLSWSHLALHMFFLKEMTQKACVFVEGEGQIFWQAGQGTVTFILLTCSFVEQQAGR